MKNNLLFIVLIAILGVNLQGGENYKLVSVKTALGLEDDDLVALSGYITKRVKRDKYEFRDETGKILVEIEDGVWKGLEIGPSDKIIVKGEIDKDMFEKCKIDVEEIKLAK